MNSHTVTDHKLVPNDSLEVQHQWMLRIVAVQLGVLFAPTVLWLWERWTMSVWHNGHGLLIALIVLYMLWETLRKLRALPRRSNPWGFVILIPSLVIHMLDTGIHTQILSAIALFLSLPGFSLLFFGTERTKAILFPLFILFLTLPIPLAITESIHLALRYITTDSVAWLLQLFGVPVFASGTLLEIEHGRVLVTDGCSGFSTLYASITVAMLTAYLCPVIRRRILVLCIAIPFAIAVNIARVLLLSLLVNWFGLDILKTSAHEISGLLTFVVVLPVIFWIGRAPEVEVSST